MPSRMDRLSCPRSWRRFCITSDSHTKEFEEALERSVPRINQAIVHSEAFAAVEHEAGVLEVVQVPRDVGLRGAEHALDVANTEFAVEQQVHDSQARRIS